MPLQFSPSQVFRDKQKNLLQKLWFLLPTNIDIHIKYSFQLVEENYFLQGAEFEGFNTDHEINQQGILYKLGLASPKYRNILSLTIDLENLTSRLTSTIRSTLKAFPRWQRALFLFFILFLPKSLSSAFLYINLIGIGVMLLISGYQTVKFFLQLLKKNNASYQGFTVNYAQSSDTTFLNDELITGLQSLQSLGITKVAYTGNCLYLYQTIKEIPAFDQNILASLFQQDHLFTEAEKTALTQKTLRFIQDPAFLSLLITSDA